MARFADDVAPGETTDFRALLEASRLRSLWRILGGYRRRYVAATAAIGLAATANAAFFYLLRYFTDEVLGRPAQRDRLVPVAAGFILLAVAQGAFTFLSGRWAAAAAEGVTRRLRDYLYDHIQRLSFAYHDVTPTGELIQRATSDVDAVRRFYAEELTGIGRVVLLFSINFIALLLMNVRLALISIVAIPLVFFMSRFFFQHISARYEAYQEQDGRLSTTLQENLYGIRVVKAFARQPYETARFERENQAKYRLGRRLLMMHAIYWPLSDIVVGAQFLVGYLIAALLAISGAISVGTFLAYVGILTWLINPLRSVGRIIVQLSQGMVSFGRIADIVREEREPLEAGWHRPGQPLRGDIRFEDVSFAYDGEDPVLADISFHAPPGALVGLVGSTGAGKSTLVNLLPRFYDYTGGRVLLDGVELQAFPRRYLREQIGIVQQEAFLFSRSIRDNITYGVRGDVGDAAVEAAARAAAIHDVIIRLPRGYDTVIGERGVTLSGGQKQRLTLARTLLKEPRILILDDATSAVDTETDAAIRAELARLLPGRTTFLIAHRLESVLDADFILVLDGGRIVQQGTHEELVAQPGRYRAMYELQSRIEDELAADLAGALRAL